MSWSWNRQGWSWEEARDSGSWEDNAAKKKAGVKRRTTEDGKDYDHVTYSGGSHKQWARSHAHERGMNCSKLLALIPSWL